MIKEILKVFGYIKLSEYKQAEKNSNVKLNKKCMDYRGRFGEYSKSRNILKEYIGKNVIFDGVLSLYDKKRGYLIKSLRCDKKRICDHVWVKSLNDVSMTFKGHQVTIEGDIVKYLKRNSVHGIESFSISSATIKMKEWDNK